MNLEEMDQCWKELAEKWKKRFWTSTRSRTAKERLTEAEVPRWNGGVYEETEITGYESGEKIAWASIFALFRAYNLQRRQSMHEDSTEEEELRRQKSDQKEEWMLKTDGGLLSCWRQIVRKRGSIQKKKKPFIKMVYLVGENEKRKMIKERLKNCINKGKSDDQECGR